MSQLTTSVEIVGYAPQKDGMDEYEWVEPVAKANLLLRLLLFETDW